jgi:hypothetical protein
LPAATARRSRTRAPLRSVGPIPLTQPLFTLIDLAAGLDTDALEAAINEADRRGLIYADQIESGLEGLPRFPGISRTQLRFANVQIRESPGYVAETLKHVIDHLTAR